MRSPVGRVPRERFIRQWSYPGPGQWVSGGGPEPWIGNLCFHSREAFRQALSAFGFKSGPLPSRRAFREEIVGWWWHCIWARL